jgi:hypothetical protein
MDFGKDESVPVGRGKLFHQGVDLAGGDCHDNPLNGADFFFCNVLLPGHAKVVLDSWLALSGHGSGQPNHRSGSSIKVLVVTDGVVEITVSFMLFLIQHHR